MDRRIFLTNPDAGAVGKPSENHANPAKTALLSTYVSNVDDHLGTDAIPVRQNTSVALARLAEQQYDACTIAVVTIEGRIIGYLPTSQSRLLAPLLDAGLKPVVRVAEVKTIPRPSIRIEIELSSPVST